jgi:hypothetical protein
VNPEIEPRARPPRFAERLVEWSLPDADREVVLGDLQEEFAATATRAGRAAAVRGYLWQAARSVASNLIRRRCELIDRYRAEDADAANDAQPFFRAYGIYVVMVIVVAANLLATYSMQLGALLAVLPAGMIALVAVLLWNPYPSPSRNRLGKARRLRRLRLAVALMLPLNLLTSLVLGPQHSSAWTAVPTVLALLASQWWPNNRWPVARADDPVES